LEGRHKGRLLLTKGKVHDASPKTGHRYTRRSTLSLTSELDGDKLSTSHPGCFTLGKEIRYPLHIQLGGSGVALNECGKSRPHRDSISGLSSP